MAMYQTIQIAHPSTVGIPGFGHWEDIGDWPKTYYYIPNQSPPQGIHPPGPIYTATTAPAPAPAPQAMYYYPGSAAAPAGYYANGMYYGTQAPAIPATGWPYSSSYTCHPLPSAPPLASPLNAWGCNNSQYYAAAGPLIPGTLWNPAAATAQVASAIAANSALAQQPNAPSYFVGGTPAEIAAQTAILQANIAAFAASQQPTTHVPFKPGNGAQVWVKETDGSWTLKDLSEALEFGPGHWEQHGTSKYWYFVKHVA